MTRQTTTEPPPACRLWRSVGVCVYCDACGLLDCPRDVPETVGQAWR